MIYLVATAVKHGRGGISTALVGLCASTDLQKAGLTLIESHRGNQSKLKAYYEAVTQIHKQVQESDIVWLHCARWLSMLRKYLLARHARKQGATIVFHFHSAVTDDYLRSPWRRWLLKQMVQLADGICVLTPWWRQRFIDELKLPEHKLHVVPNTLDEEFLQATPKLLSIDNGPIKMLCMTRLVAGKNVAAVLHALAILPTRYHLSIAGEGPELQNLQQLAIDLGIKERINFLGWVDYDKKINVLQQHHLFILPSQFDAFGMGFIEAMAIGLPVIALTQGPTPDVVPHQQAGYLCEDVSTAELLRAIDFCTTHYTSLTTAAREHARQQFAVAPTVQSLLNFFSTLPQR
ncbi:hypothetical protein CWE21_10825 [Pseudidiomarina aquimaris]|uniref:Glycosyltransferase family 1 protein n=1 Tax=Pseudidiomarina aquimaris TaxID=641841 RepID=A0A432XD84_9GAMM|nr:glycosyltransferase family 4 protein [Pseudidiomarina aquimaris]RUO46640.1 hypothetical protein CWE21_10825 [Pseudidiomarina aquimaris]